MRLTHVDRSRIKRDFASQYPDDLLNVEMEYDLIGREISLDEIADASGMGAEMQWMTIEEKFDEAFRSFPGIVALQYGYFPVAKCLEGSGDPYFFSSRDGNSEVWRIPHEAIHSNDTMAEDQVEFVCSLSLLISHFNKQGEN